MKIGREGDGPSTANPSESPPTLSLSLCLSANLYTALIPSLIPPPPKNKGHSVTQKWSLFWVTDASCEGLDSPPPPPPPLMESSLIGSDKP